MLDNSQMAIRREDGDGSVVAAHDSVRRCVGTSATHAAMQPALSAMKRCPVVWLGAHGTFLALGWQTEC